MIKDIKSKIVSILQIAEENISYNPDKRSYGDLSIPLFRVSKQTGTSLERIATEMVRKLTSLEVVDRSEFINGYVNIFFNWKSIFKSLVQKGINIQKVFNETILIEYSQPNTHKPFHVGHLRNACLGSALVNLCRKLCNRVIAINYPGDIGTHVASCIWYMLKTNKQLPNERVVDFLGDCYFNAVQMLELENLTYFPHTECAFGEIVSAQPPIYGIRIGSNMVQAHWDGKEIQLERWCLIANRKSKIFKLIANKEIELDWVVVPKKFISQTPENDAVLFTNPPEDLDPIEYFRKDKSQKNIYETHTKRIKEVSQVLRDIENKIEPAWSVWKVTRDKCLQDFKVIYEWLGCEFDFYFFESELTEMAQNLVEEYLQKKIFTVHDGAVGIDLQDLGFLILRKNDGNVLYSTRDLALAIEKSKKFNFDRSIYVVDQAQSLHFKQVFRTLEKIGYEEVNKLYHLGYALVITKEGKISSRSKNYYTFWKLKDLATQTIFESYYACKPQNENTRELAEKLAKACIRYGMLKVENSSPVIFDLNEWLNINGNSGAYIVYTYARLRSIVDKTDSNFKEVDISNLESEEIEVLSYIIYLEEVLHSAYLELSPHIICEYLYKFCQSINKLYNKWPVLKAPEPEKIKRLKLIDLTLKVMEVCMDILGLDTLSRV